MSRIRTALKGYYPLNGHVNDVSGSGLSGSILGTPSWLKNQAGKVVLDDTTAGVTHVTQPTNSFTYWKDGHHYAVVGSTYYIDGVVSGAFTPSVTNTNIGYRFADHAWDFDVAYLSGTTLADLGNNATKWDLTRINSAGLGTLVFNGVTYSAAVFDGVNMKWRTENTVANLCASPFVIEFIGKQAVTTTVNRIAFSQREAIADITQASNLFINDMTNDCPGYKVYGSPTSNALSTVSISTNSVYVAAGFGSDRKPFICVNNASYVGDAIAAYLTTAKHFTLGGLYAGVDYIMNGSISRMALHLGLTNKTSTTLRDAALTRFNDYIAGSVGDFRIWGGL